VRSSELLWLQLPPEMQSCGCELYIGLQNLGPGRANCPNTFVGDPVNVTTGNFYVTKKDIQIPTRGIPLEIRRYYNSIDQTCGILGKGWRIGYETGLMRVEDSQDILTVYPDGSIGVFELMKKTINILPHGEFLIYYKRTKMKALR